MLFLNNIIRMALTGIFMLLNTAVLVIAYVSKNPKIINSIIMAGLRHLDQIIAAKRYEFYRKTITELGDKSVDLHEYQKSMEVLFSNNQLHARLKQEFQENPAFAIHMQEHGIDVDFGYDLLVQMHLHKRASVSVLVGILNHHFAGDVQATADALLVAAEHDLMDWDDKFETFVVIYTITQDVQDIVDTYQYPLPMVVQPKALRSNYDSGYLNNACSIILKNNHHNEDVCLDFINKINKTKLRINLQTANLVHNKWKNIDKKSKNETFDKWKQRQKQFDKYNRTAHDVMHHLAIAGNEFYLTHRYDKRGRVYCQGYHVNYQGTAWNKSVIEFAEGEIVDGFN